MAAAACPAVSDAVACEILKLLLAHGADASGRDEGGRTALFHAIPYRDRVATLLDAGADVGALDAAGCSVLAVALDSLAEHENARQMGAMMETFMRLVGRPGAAGFGDVPRTVALLRQRDAPLAGHDWLALLRAVREGHEAEVSELLARGVDPNHEQGAALRLAARSGHLRIVKRLLDAGSDPEAVADDGGSLLDAAASRLEVLEYLLERGIRTAISDDALHQLDHARRTATTDRERWRAVFERLSEHPRALLTLGPLSKESRALLDAASLDAELFSELRHEKLHLLESAPLDPSRAIELFDRARERLASWSPVLIAWSLRDNAGSSDEIDEADRALERRTAAAWFRKRERSYRSWFQEQAAEIAEADIPPPRLRDPSFGQRPRPHPLHLLLVNGPADLAPVAYRFGGGNERPDPVELAVVLRSWRTRFRAELVYLGETMELALPTPLADPAQVREAAREHVLFCPESESAEHDVELASSSCWTFWWD
jgi:hypothetical protein